MLLLVSAVAAVLIIALLLQSRDRGQPHDSYFSAIQDNLREAAPGRPIMLVDMNRVDANIQRVRHHVGDTSKVRVVAKSLPCPELLKYLLDNLGSNRLMVFHQPFLNQLFQTFPEGDFLIGKPFPVKAVRTFLAGLKEENRQRTQQIQWLIDSQSRLEQYLSLAREADLKLRINIEINVGLQRGGLNNPEDANALLSLIQDNPQHLEFAGYMGYDAHLGKVPLPSLLQPGRKKVLELYAAFVDQLRHKFPELYKEDLCFNSAGSMTYQLYPESDRGVINDISIGSAFVKPTDFDLLTLEDHVQGLFIATPVLKKHEGLLLPFVGSASRALTRFNANLRQSYFIYGGWWKADTCSPAGLSNNSLYGRSTNQELLTGSAKTGLDVDDYVFLRPTQSEFVMLQFGQLHTLRNGLLEDKWAAFGQDY